MQDQEQVQRFRRAQGRIEEATYQQHKTYAYTAGYFQSLALEMFRNLNKKQQAEFLRQLEQDAVRLETLAGLVN